MSDEGIEVFGGAEVVHSQAGRGRHAGSGYCRKAGISWASYFPLSYILVNICSDERLLYFLFLQ